MKTFNDIIVSLCEEDKKDIINLMKTAKLTKKDVCKLVNKHSENLQFKTVLQKASTKCAIDLVDIIENNGGMEKVKNDPKLIGIKNKALELLKKCAEYTIIWTSRTYKLSEEESN